jgi:DNA polymerase-4
VGQRLRGKSLEGSTVTLKVRRSDFSTVTRSRSFEPPTADTGTLLGIGHELLDRWLGEHPLAAVRLLGVGVGGLVPTGQLDLFAAPEATSGSLGATVDPTRVGAKLDPTLDQIRARFGDTAVRRASSLDRPDKNDGFTGVRRR